MYHSREKGMISHEAYYGTTAEQTIFGVFNIETTSPHIQDYHDAAIASEGPSRRLESEMYCSG
jgi:hypothetical protein